MNKIHSQQGRRTKEECQNNTARRYNSESYKRSGIKCISTVVKVIFLSIGENISTYWRKRYKILNTEQRFFRNSILQYRNQRSRKKCFNYSASFSLCIKIFKIYIFINNSCFNFGNNNELIYLLTDFFLQNQF